MSLLQKTFRIGLGGRGTKEVERFISTHIGRDLTLIEGLDATSINSNTTELTLIYRDYPDTSPILASNPPNGFIASTGHPVDTLYLQYSTPIDKSSIQTGDIIIDGNVVTGGEFVIESGTNDYVMRIRTTAYYNDPSPFPGIHTALLDKSIKNTFGKEQNNSSLIGYTHSSRAGPSVGDPFVHSANDLRGTTKLRYAIFDSSVNTNKKLGEMIKTANELLAFTSVQKPNSTTEVFTLVTDQLEPRIVGTFPRQGANNPDTDEFKTLTLTFQDPIDVNQVSHQSGVFGLNAHFGLTNHIATGNVKAIDNKTVQLSVANQVIESSIQNNYMNVMVYAGLRAQGGLATTKGYTFGYSTNDFALAGGTGPEGPPGPTGASGVPGDPGGPPGPTGATGVSGIPGFSGVPGISGVPGADGRDGERGDTGVSGTRWYHSGGAPQDSFGAVPGDYFLHADNPFPGPGAIYQRVDTEWIITGNIRGPSGEKGEQGAGGIGGDPGPPGPEGATGASGAVGPAGESPAPTLSLPFTGVHDRVEIDLAFKVTSTSPYFTGDSFAVLNRDVSGNITSIDTYNDVSLSTQMFRKAIGRDVSGNITGVFTTDLCTQGTLRTIIERDVSGNITTVEKLYTQ